MSKFNGKFRIGILGAGSVSEVYHLPVLKNMPNTEISWLCDLDKERAARLGKMFAIPHIHNNLDECVEVDIVLVAIPVGFRRELLKKVFSRGWHVLCEKPFATTLSDQDEILKEASCSGVQVGVGLMRRYYQSTLIAKKIIDAQIFGPLKKIWANEGTFQAATGRSTDWYQADPQATGGGILMEWGVHLVDQVITILSAVDYEILDSRRVVFNDIEMDNKISSILVRDKEERVPFNCAVSQTKNLYNGIVFEFSQASLRIGQFPDDPIRICDNEGEIVANLCDDMGAEKIYQAFFLEWEDFINQCKGEGNSKIDANKARLVTSFIEECYRESKDEMLM